MELLIFVVGVAVGFVVFKKLNTVGSLRVDLSDPDDSPYLFLELEKDVSYVCQKKYLLLKVSVNNFVTHK